VHLNQVFSFRQDILMLSTAELVGVAVSSLGERVGRLREHRQEIIAALDFLFSGF